jgi:predicted transcriptional regulator of viral defense system
LGLEFEFIRVQPQRFFGFQEEWVSQWHRVQITDRERTVLDLFAAPQVFGSLQTGFETLETYWEQFDLDRLVVYTLRYAVGATIKRLGWALEALGAPESTFAPLRAYRVQAWAQLDPTGPAGGTPVAAWKLRNNLYSGDNDAHR